LDRYLIVGRKQRYSKATVRLTTKSPSLESYEVAIKINLDIPDELFTKPQLQASITVSKDAVSAPVIEADVVDNISEIISKELGIDLNIAVVPNQ